MSTFGLTPNCPEGYGETELIMNKTTVFVLYYRHSAYGELDDWQVYLKGSDIELGEFVVGNRQLCLLVMAQIADAVG